MNQTMYIASWDSQIVLVTKPYSHWINEILSSGASFNIDKNSVRNTLKCVWHVQQISAIYIIQDIELGYIIQYWWKCVPNSLKCVWQGPQISALYM